MRWPAFSTGVRAQASASGGSSLIEVMLAVALVAVSALGLIAAQVWTAREAHAMSLRESATWIADSIAEATRTPSVGNAALDQSSGWASVLLPQGDASIGASGAVASARVTWASVRDRPIAGDGIGPPAEPCGDVDAPAGSSCVALAFAK
ncbi:Tfp pilus assembly protein PilV [Paraburkholderia youngii]|uniref:type IV pilus modification PilV family protein n=1 Tax=Paraburkholderia TaxID=1822464 RepID=UPI0034CF3A69